MFHLLVLIVIGYTQIVIARRDLSTQRVVLQPTALKFAGTLLITEEGNVQSLQRFSGLFHEDLIASLLVNEVGRLAARVHRRHESRFAYDTSEISLRLFIWRIRYNFEVEHEIVNDFTDDISRLNVGLLKVSMAVFKGLQRTRYVLHKNKIFHVLLSLKNLNLLNFRL